MDLLTVTSGILGAVIGFILALTGAGGASLAIPVLVLFLDITVFEAAPIALLAVFMASSIGAIQGLQKGIVRYKTALLIALVGIAITPIGVNIAANVPDFILTIILCSVLLFIGIHTWQSTKQTNLKNSQSQPAACTINPITSKVFWTSTCTKWLVATGAITGFLSGLLGVGGGFIVVPSLNKVSNFDHRTVIATTLAAVSLIAIGSIFSHLHTNTVNWQIAIPFAISTTATMLVISAFFSHKIPKQLSQKGFAIVCIIAAANLAIKMVI